MKRQHSSKLGPTGLLYYVLYTVIISIDLAILTNWLTQCMFKQENVTMKNRFFKGKRERGQANTQPNVKIGKNEAYSSFVTSIPTC